MTQTELAVYIKQQ